MSNFRIGMLVKTDMVNRYSITNNRTICAVLDSEDERLKVFVVGKDNTFDGNDCDLDGGRYDVDASCFRPLTANELFEYKNSGHWTFIEEFDEKMENGSYFLAESVPEPTCEQTVMDMSATIDFPAEEREALKTEMEKLLDEYDYGHTDDGINSIIDVWRKNKQWIDALLSKHPNYVKGKHYVCFSADYERQFNKGAVVEFANWLEDVSHKILQKKDLKIGSFNRSQIDEILNHTEIVIDRMEGLMYTPYSHFTVNDVTFNGFDINHYRRERNRFLALRRKLLSLGTLYGSLVVPNDIYVWFRTVELFKTTLVQTIERNILDEETAAKFNEICPELNAVAGQKVSRMVNRFCTIMELNKIKEMAVVSDTGRMADIGYNQRFAHFADGINPIKVKKYTIISVNPIDYWTMSFGNGWASCHTIDKENRRRATGQHYSGCYSSGTESYMLDSSAIVMYTVSADYNGKDFELQDKERRVMFFLGEDKFIQSRLYPDGRDGGDSGMQQQFREIFQKVIADCSEVSNLWEKPLRGSSHCSDYSRTNGTHYADYVEYEDGVVSFLKRDGVEKNHTKIRIGHAPICPICGREHEETEYITCDDCRENNLIHCSRCGSVIDMENAIRDEDTGDYYCDYECAEAYSCYYCENVGEWHSNHVYWDDYHGRYFYSRWEDYVCTEDGNYFEDAEDAVDAGYAETESGEWYPEEEVRYCSRCESYVHESNYNDELDCCENCATEIEEEATEESVA